MCGRYTLYTEHGTLIEYFDLDGLPLYEARYNIAPGQHVIILRNDPDNARHWDRVRWGLIPSWAKDEKIGYKMINARAETLPEKPAFRAAFKQRRCLIPADGFYEWHREGAHKQAYYFHHPEHHPLALAGLWESWTHGGETLRSCAIITTEAKGRVAPVHARMPLILTPRQFTHWLNPAHDARALLNAGDAELAAYRVTDHVNNPRHEDAACIRAQDETD